VAVACELARAAGRAAMAHYGSARAEAKGGGSPVTAADRAANEVIVTALKARFPGDAILSEESRDTSHRLTSRRLWIVDPLDGTKEFLAMNGEFAVMVGLVEAGEAVAGAVYLPDPDVLMWAARGEGAWLERGSGPEPLRCAAADPSALRAVGSRSHPDALLTRMHDALRVADVAPSGSVGVKCGLIARGERDVYIHPVPYLKEWDTCAPEVILREAGGEVTDCRGDRLEYNKPDPRQPHGIVATGGGVHERILAAIAPVYAAAVPAGS
jgi:3'(2'), 5'-bisphosphate nucleotidase